jgi:hypothetical protein
MKELTPFISQNKGLLIIVFLITCILIGRIWSNYLNWGNITGPTLVIKKGKHYKVVNLYIPKAWTEDWIVGSIICFKTFDRRFFIKSSRNIYVSGDRIRFPGDGPSIGSFYEAVFPRNKTGPIIMKIIQTPSKV